MMRRAVMAGRRTIPSRSPRRSRRAGARRRASKAARTPGSRRRASTPGSGGARGGRLGHARLGAVGPERVVVPARRLGEEPGRLPLEGGVHLPFPLVEEVERDAGQRRVGQRGVRDDGGEPPRREGLLDAVGRQRVDERSGVADQQHAGGLVGTCVVDGGVAAPGLDVERGPRGQGAERRGLRELRLVTRREGPAARQAGDPGVDHQGEVALLGRHRDRPRPAVPVALDQGVRLVVEAPPAAPGPHRGEGKRGAPGRVPSEPVSGDDPGAARAVQHEPRRQGPAVPPAR